MDHDIALDLRFHRKSVESLSNSSNIVHPLDLRLPKNENECDKTELETEHCMETLRPSVIKPNLQFSSNFMRQRSRWNYRSHPSIDSDSSFESEQENDLAHSNALQPPRIYDKSYSLRCDSTESIGRRESSSNTDTENDSETCEQRSSLSMGFYKELPDLTANVSIGLAQETSMILELSSCQAEIMYPEEVQLELENGSQNDNEMKDEINANCLQIIETDTYLEEFLQIQSGKEGSPSSSKIPSTIEDMATKYIKEIQKTKSDMGTEGLNLEVDGKKKRHCIKCAEEFHSSTALLKHLMTHSSLNPGEKIIKCPVCTKRFSTLTILENHIQKLHTGEMKYVCQMCETPFKFSTHLKKHMITSRCGKGTKKVT